MFKDSYLSKASWACADSLPITPLASYGAASPCRTPPPSRASAPTSRRRRVCRRRNCTYRNRTAAMSQQASKHIAQNGAWTDNAHAVSIVRPSMDSDRRGRHTSTWRPRERICLASWSQWGMPREMYGDRPPGHALSCTK